MSGIPQPPPGFVVVDSPQQIPPPPPGFEIIPPNAGDAAAMGAADVRPEVRGGIRDLILNDGKAKPQEGAGVIANVGAGASRGIYGDILGGPVDLVNAGLKQVGLGSERPFGGSEDMRAVSDWIAGGRVEPVTEGERIAYAGGRAGGQALGTMAGGHILAQANNVGQLAQGAGRAMTTQPLTQLASAATGGAVSEATDNPWLGLLAALAVPAGVAGVQRVITPVTNQLNPEQMRLAQVLQHEGVPLNAAQQTGSKGLKTLDSVLDNLPISGGRNAAEKAAQRTAFNRAVMRQAGENADTATPDVINRAYGRLGGEFDNLARQTTVQFDQRLATDLTNVAQRYGRLLPSQQRGVVQNVLDDIAQTGGTMTGQQYQRIRSDLSRAASSAAKNDPYYAEALRGIRNALDDVAGRSMGPQTRAEWDEVRRQYGNLKTIGKSVESTGELARGGDIPPKMLANALKQNNPTGYTRGRGDLNDIARAGAEFLGDPIPNSGTAQRMFWQGALTGGAGGMAAFDPVAAATMFGAPALAQALTHSPAGQAWLTNQIIQRGPQQTQQLIAAILANRGLDSVSGPIGGQALQGPR